MFKKRTKIMVVLAVVILVITATTASEPDESKLGLSYKNSDLDPNDPNFPLNNTDSLNTGKMFAQLMLTMLIVIALGIAAFYMSKKVGSKIVNISGRKIRLIETFHLGTRKAVHLIEVENHKLLIGSTQTNITKIADLTDNPENLVVPD